VRNSCGCGCQGWCVKALDDTVIRAGLACVDEALEAEHVALCGERYAHLSERQAVRAGHVASSLVLGGRRVGVSRPRVRSVAGSKLRVTELVGLERTLSAAPAGGRADGSGRLDPALRMLAGTAAGSLYASTEILVTVRLFPHPLDAAARVR
jgi:hypothetical protein